MSRFEHFPLDQWDFQLDVGLKGVFLCSQVFVTAMAKRGSGVIVNIASDLSITAPDQRLYRRTDRPEEQQPVKLEQFNPPCYKIASASLTDDNLLKHHRHYGRPMIISTDMSTLDEIDHAVDILGTENLLIMHCTSTYPSKPEEFNLQVIQTLKERYQLPIGYSGHESGLATTMAAVAMGACCIE